MFTRILVPIDFSAPSDAALVYAKGIAAHFGARLHVVHVTDSPSPALAPALDADAPQASTELLHGPCAKTIVDAARRHHCDLIVMGTHGRTGMTHALMGSVAEDVVRHAECPVLTVHGPRLDAMEAREPVSMSRQMLLGFAALRLAVGGTES